MSGNQQRRLLWLVRTTEQAVALIEDLTGEKVTPEEIEELRRVFDDEQHNSPPSLH